MIRAVTLRGGVYDIYRLTELELELKAIEPHNDVTLDLSKTELIDCTAIGRIIARLRAWRESVPDAKLNLINVSPRICRTLELLELDRIFLITERSE